MLLYTTFQPSTLWPSSLSIIFSNIGPIVCVDYFVTIDPVILFLICSCQFHYLTQGLNSWPLIDSNFWLRKTYINYTVIVKHISVFVLSFGSFQIQCELFFILGEELSIFWHQNLTHQKKIFKNEKENINKNKLYSIEAKYTC